MQKFMAIGRLTKDVEVSTTSGGVSVAKFTIAVDRSYKIDGEKVADFFNVVAWRGLADNISKYCKKGSKVYVSGELQNRFYESDGTKKYVTEIIANECEFLTRSE